MTWVSTRFAYKILSSVFNHDQTEVAANPVHLMYVLEQRIGREDYPEEIRRRYLDFIKGYLAPRYAEFIGKDIQTDRKRVVEGKGGAVRVDHGCRRMIKKKKLKITG